MSSPFTILKESPHDRRPPAIAQPEAQQGATQWVPSRYNIRALADDGRLILWNTFRNSMSVFQPHQVSKITSMLSQKGFAARPEGIVKYLVDRGFLIQHGTNEYRQVQVAINQQQFRTDRLEFILLASEDCNFRCTYCYEKFERGTMIPQVRTGIKNLVTKNLKRLTSLQVSWFGGEPLYGLEAIEDLAPFFVETAEANDIYYSAGMTTNGYLLTPETAEKLLGWNVRSFQITMDGVEEDHDRSRPTRDGRGTFATILSNLISLQKRDDSFNVTLRVNFDQQNHPRLGTFLEQIQEHFANDERFRLHLFPVGRWGGPQDADLQVCGTDEADKVRKELKAQARRRGITVGTLKGTNHLGGDVCYAARPYNFIVGATGKLMKCTIALDQSDYNVVGYLTEEGDVHLDRDKMALWTEPAFEHDNRCQKCVVLPVCQGTHCPLVRIVDNKSPCSSIRTHSKEQLREILQVQGEETRRTLIGADGSLSEAAGG